MCHNLYYCTDQWINKLPWSLVLIYNTLSVYLAVKINFCSFKLSLLSQYTYSNPYCLSKILCLAGLFLYTISFLKISFSISVLHNSMSFGKYFEIVFHPAHVFFAPFLDYTQQFHKIGFTPLFWVGAVRLYSVVLDCSSIHLIALHYIGLYFILTLVQMLNISLF